MNIMVPPSSATLADPDSPPPAASRRPLRVLLVEDSEDDAALVLRLLRRNGYEPEWERVQTQLELEAALAGRTWDLVLSDYHMPQLDALRALRTTKGMTAHLPFIIVSGSIGEETAVAAMVAGASDYVMKTNLPRLIPAVERELREAAEREERESTERAFLDLQGKFQAIFHEYLDVMLVLDAAGTVLHANLAARRTMGYDERQLVGRSFVLLWPERQQGAADQILEGVRQEGSAFFSGTLRRMDGSLCPMDLQASRVPWGHKEAIIVSLRDVSERQQAQRRLQDEKEQLAVTLRSMADGVITTDVLGRVVLMNGEAERLTGWNQVAAKGQPFETVLQLTCQDEDRPCEGLQERVLRSGEPIQISRRLQSRDRAGRQYALALKAAPIATHGGGYSGVVTVFRDTTVEQKMEAELQKASKLESVALVAGGIAHDFNNILTAMLGHLSLAKTQGEPVPPVLATIEKACVYATGLTRQLLTFAKGSDPVRRLEDVAELVEESVRFSLHGTSVRCRFDLAGDLRPAELDRGQIHQVINNLVINAVQASQEGGGLHVEARNVAVGREEDVPTLAAGPYVRVSVRDSGTGISPENLARIFDPYFTTKRTGSGLGLATSYSILKQHGGLIRVESVLGVGSTFTIYLPAGAWPTRVAESAAKPALARGKSASPGGRVLFMDDEAILQELVGAMLDHLGYEVTCASSGEEAVALYREAQAEGRPFDAIIADLTVPGGMGGQEAMRRVLQIDPAAKGLVSSGYSNDPIMADFREHGFSGAIAKPYQMTELSQALQQVLTSSHAGD